MPFKRDSGGCVLGYFNYNVIMTKQSGFLGEFEQMVLLAILRLGDEAYGVKVVEELRDQADREVNRGSLYLTLDRLEAKGMLESVIAKPTPERGGRGKRYLTVTPAGARALQKSRLTLLRLWQGVETVLEES